MFSLISNKRNVIQNKEIKFHPDRFFEKNLIPMFDEGLWGKNLNITVERYAVTTLLEGNIATYLKNVKTPSSFDLLFPFLRILSGGKKILRGKSEREIMLAPKIFFQREGEKN